MGDTKAVRRRGKALEDAILQAAWVELTERGYANLTLEAVAKRAGTSRPVLHRRWPSRTQLVAAVLARHVALNPIVVPDLGNVRDELAMALRALSERGAPTLIRLMLEMSADLARERSNFIQLKAKITGRSLVAEILQRGVDRGEIDPAKLTPRIASLPTDLARHEVMMTLDRISDAAIDEILDQIFLPLVSRAARAR